MKILAVIPAHNEANSIADVVNQVKGLGYDALVVDDGSVDATSGLANKAGAIVLSTGRKGGKGNALRLGFDDAIQNNYDVVITLDGDGQHAPSDMKNLLDVYERTKAAIVNGNRMHNPKGMPALRWATNKFMSWVISLICRQAIPDTQCGYRLVTTEALRSIKLECSDFEIETELLIKASRQGYKIASAPIATIYRDEVSKIHPIKDTLRFIRFISRVLAEK